jgi:hypothetical protein
VSHFDVSAEPSLLMEPAITGGLSSDVDLTRAAFADLGWFAGLVDAPIARTASRIGASAPNPTAGASALSFTLAHAEQVDLRVYDLAGREVARLHHGPLPQGRHVVRWDGRGFGGALAAPGIYHYRLRTPSTDETRTLVVAR